MRNRLPVTTVPQTLFDLAATQPFADLRRAVAEADYRRHLDPAEVEAELGRGKKSASSS